MEVAIIGGGAAGFFSAIAVKENYPRSRVVIFEKSKELLAKVKISGGGRCNVTNGCPSIKKLSAAYPRGGKWLKKSFQIFNNNHAMKWFESRGVPLVIQDDDCVFPRSQNSQSIIDCFLRQAEALQIEIELGKGIKKIKQVDEKLELHFIPSECPALSFDKVIVAIGGCPKRDMLQWLEALHHKIEDPVPSLFTFNIPGDPITGLMGIVVKNTIVSIPGTALKSTGPLLITHWGMSGPAILTLSSFGARILSEKGYECDLLVNWPGEQNKSVVMDVLNALVLEHPQKLLSTIRPYILPERLWTYLLEKSDIPIKKKWGDLGKKGLNKVMSVLTNDLYTVKGKTSFKEEFVTCGGVSQESIDIHTMESKVCKNLYFAGEVMDIDGITGGFNFQAAWTTGFIAGQLG